MTAVRRRKFRVDRRVDGAPWIGVEVIISGDREPLLRVRLARRRDAIEVPLGDVAEMLIWRAAKARAAEKAKARKTKRSTTGTRR